MEEVKEKKNSNGLLIVLVILLVLALGYIGYDKVLSKDTKKEEKVEEKQQEKEETKEDTKDAATVFIQNMKKNRKLTVDYEGRLLVILDKDGKVYYNSEQVKDAVGTKGTYKLSEKAFVNVVESEKTDMFTGYKLDIENVVAMYYTRSGQEALYNYFFLKEDGSVAHLAFVGENDNLSIARVVTYEKNCKGLKNIVGIIQDDDFSSLSGHESFKLVDINGNVFDENYD